MRSSPVTAGPNCCNTPRSSKNKGCRRTSKWPGCPPRPTMGTRGSRSGCGHRLRPARPIARLSRSSSRSTTRSWSARASYELPIEKLVSDCRLEYDHPDGRPVLRSLVTTIPGQHRTIRLDVEECRFGPIPETEFALEPFLADLKPGEIIRKPVVEPAIATLLGWYWMAFVAGGISLAGGSGLALRSRDRDRQAPRAD